MMTHTHANIDAERGILSACFLDERIIHSCITRGLTPDSFYDAKHKTIFGLLIEMKRVGRTVDLITFFEFAREKKSLDDCGGIPGVNRVTESLETTSSANQWIDIVLNKAVARHVLRQAELLTLEVSENPSDAQKAAVGACRRLNEVCQSSSEMTQEQIGQASVDWFMRRCDPERQQKTHSIDLGITGIHDHIAPLSYDDDVTMAVIIAPPDGGKSTIERQIARVNCSQGKVVARFLRETSAEVSNGQMAAAWAGFDLLKAKKPPQRNEFKSVIEYDYAMSEWKSTRAEAIERLHEIRDEWMGKRLFVYDKDKTIGEIESRCRYLADKTGGLDLITVDYLQKVKSDIKGWSRENEVADISSRLQDLGAELRCTVLCLCQMSRGSRTGIERVIRKGPNAGSKFTDLPTPQMTDIRESGAIEQDARWMGAIHIPALDKDGNKQDKSTLRPLTEFHVLKSKIGHKPTIELIYDKPIQTFRRYV